jgi:outer membrane receptor protein involved in Fe transport
MLRSALRLTALLLLAALGVGRPLLAQPAPAGTITGVVMDARTKQPIEYATVTLKATDGRVLSVAATDAKGRFVHEQVPDGDYVVAYGAVGETAAESRVFAVTATHRASDLGTLSLTPTGAPLELARVQVSAQRETFYNSIDRKTYNVGKDIQSTTGSASDLLQNVPSVQVDVEGNVSLRGSTNVLILVNGKTSTLMGRNRAAVLEQMPADGIDKIEVITNPSAKYKPDGTAGIINITMKRKQDPGYSASVRASVGNNRRYNGSVTGNFNPGRWNVFGTVALRQDDRPRTATDDRSHFDATAGGLLSTSQRVVEESRPLSRIVQTGADYKLSDDTKVGGTFNYNYRDFVRTGTETNLSRNPGGVVTGDYDRIRTDPEYEKDIEFGATLEHTWPKLDHELKLEVQHGRTTEQEDNNYRTVRRLPVAAPTFDRSVILSTEENTEVMAEGTYNVDESTKIEAGYSWRDETSDLDFRGTFLEPVTNTWLVDPVKTNRFLYESGIHALYATAGRPFGPLGVLAGLRFEQATVDTDQRTTHVTDRTVYAKLYPTLHLNYSLTDRHQLQLNYSHRVHRPEGEDLNPYPEFLDPFNLRAGNPHLKPEDIHSIEGGYQYKHDDTSFLAALYYRSLSNGFTSVTRYLDSTTLLTTRENLATSRSGGLELAATTSVGKSVSLNFSGNVYRNEIDARNLGFSDRRSTIAWDAKLNANWNVTKSTTVQFNTNYSAKRLTPQGYRYPTHVLNLGLRHNFADKKTSFILTGSDLLDSLKERTLIDTPTLHQDATRRRTARIFYAGFIYNFGKASKKSKDDLQFDNQP